MSEKTVILLGAGASRASDYRLPTMRTFFEGPGLPPELLDFLRRHYPEEDASFYNLEDVLTHLYLNEVRLPIWTDFLQSYMHRLGYPYADLLQVVRARLHIHGDSLCAKHVALFDEVGPEDTVITLNYDLVADQALHRHPRLNAEFDGRLFLTRVDQMWRLLGFAPSVEGASLWALGRKEAHPGYYLKLHGSINWMRCRDPECPGPFRVPDPPDTVEFVTAATAWCEFCGAALESAIVPPVLAKATSIQGRIQKMWKIALWELSRATRIIVWGISFAPSDVDLRWLIRFSSQSRDPDIRPVVHVINPDEAARTTALRLFAPVGERHEWDGVDEYLEARAGEGRRRSP